MTPHGLQEIGLSDWPVWFRKENPGYFLSDSRSGGVPGRIGRGRRGAGSGAVGAGACCGPLHAVNGAGGSGERLRGNVRVVVRERASGRLLRSGELGEQIIARLRGMSKEGKVFSEKVVSGGGGGNAMIERAAARDTKNWEDESEDDADDDDTDEGEDKAMANGKLVDV
jgi:hypothetical protein